MADFLRGLKKRTATPYSKNMKLAQLFRSGDIIF
jgi:hypothetical protein